MQLATRLALIKARRALQAAIGKLTPPDDADEKARLVVQAMETIIAHANTVMETLEPFTEKPAPGSPLAPKKGADGAEPERRPVGKQAKAPGFDGVERRKQPRGQQNVEAAFDAKLAHKAVEKVVPALQQIEKVSKSAVIVASHMAGYG